MRQAIIMLFSVFAFYSCSIQEDPKPHYGTLKVDVRYTDGVIEKELVGIRIGFRGIDEGTRDKSEFLEKTGTYTIDNLRAGKYVFILEGSRCKVREWKFMSDTIDIKVSEPPLQRAITIEQTDYSVVIRYLGKEVAQGDTIILESGAAFDIWNRYSSKELKWNIAFQPPWITFEETNGTVAGGGIKSMVFSIDKSKMPNSGDNYDNVILKTEDNGSFTVKIKATDDPVLVTGVMLNKTVTTLAVDETEQLTATIQPNNATNVTMMWSSDNTSIATVSNAGLITTKAAGTATITVTTYDGNKKAFCAVSVKNGVRINGIIWAKSNVDLPGTFSSSPESSGRFYQWNRISTDIDWEWNGYFYAAWDSSIPSGTTWEKENCPCPQGWRVPTRTELESLIEAGSIWTDSYGIGRRFGSGDNTIFLPDAADILNSDGVHGLSLGRTGTEYWSSTQTDSNNAYTLYISVNNISISRLNRACGTYIRCVAE